MVCWIKKTWENSSFIKGQDHPKWGLCLWGIKKFLKYSVPLMLAALALPILHIIIRGQLFQEDGYSQLGVLSILIIVCSGFAIGAVLALQGYTQLVRVGSESALGLGVALVLVMEIGPVVSALLFAGRAGSAVTAEIGLMKATEQLASMELSLIHI